VIRADDRIDILSKHADPEIKAFFGNEEKLWWEDGHSLRVISQSRCP
jgi:hypothetical protein